MATRKARGRPKDIAELYNDSGLIEKVYVTSPRAAKEEAKAAGADEIYYRVPGAPGRRAHTIRLLLVNGKFHSIK